MVTLNNLNPYNNPFLSSESHCRLGIYTWVDLEKLVKRGERLVGVVVSGVIAELMRLPDSTKTGWGIYTVGDGFVGFDSHPRRQYLGLEEQNEFRYITGFTLDIALCGEEFRRFYQSLLEERMRQSDSILLEEKLFSVEERVVRGLIRMAERMGKANGETIELEIDSAHLALLLGIPKRQVSETLRKLRDGGVIGGLEFEPYLGTKQAIGLNLADYERHISAVRFPPRV